MLKRLQEKQKNTERKEENAQKINNPRKIYKSKSC